MSNSYQSIKDDIKKNKKAIILIIAVLFFIYLISNIVIFTQGEKRFQQGMGQVKDKDNDYRVSKLMWSTQDALEDYYDENNAYPTKLDVLKIEHTDDSFEIVDGNTIEFLGYPISYEITQDGSYILETDLQLKKERYVLYGDN